MGCFYADMDAHARSTPQSPLHQPGLSLQEAPLEVQADLRDVAGSVPDHRHKASRLGLEFTPSALRFSGSGSG